MTRLLSLILVVLALTAPVVAQTQYVTLAEITVGSAAANVFTNTDILAGNGHPAAQSASCSLSGANVRATWDGQTPTTSLGEVFVPGNWTFVGTQVLVNLKMIRDDSTDATLNCILTRQ